MHLFPETPWEILVKLEYLSFYLSLTAFVFFMRSLFSEFSKVFQWVVGALGLAFSCMVLVTPVRIFSSSLPIFETITGATAVYGVFVLILALLRKRDGAVIFLIGFIILALSTLNDMLHVENIIRTDYIAPYGLFIFILSQAFLLSLRYSKLLKTVEMQWKDLRDTLQAYKTEISERKGAEDALRESEEKYRTILDGIEDGYYEVDLAGNLTFFNESLCKILGYPKDELIGKNNREYTSKETAKKMFQTFNEVFNTGKAAKAFDWTTIRKDGATRYLETSITLMRDPTGNPIGFRGIARDITERKQADEQAKVHQHQLMQASKMVALGTLVSGVAHEINNPNNFIMLNMPILTEAWENATPILEEYYKENGDFVLGGVNYSEIRENIPKLFAGISEGSKRIKQIVNELKTYLRKESSDLTQSADINAVVESALSLLSNTIKKSTHSFSINYGKHLPTLRGNFQRLEQVMINLIQNACQALPDPSKRIDVSTTCDRLSRIVIQVIDEGNGIPYEDLPHIIDPFFTTKHDSGGVGLGLSISSKIVEEHGGTMSFTSKPGKGTTAEIILPVDGTNTTSKGINQ